MDTGWGLTFHSKVWTDHNKYEINLHLQDTKLRPAGHSFYPVTSPSPTALGPTLPNQTPCPDSSRKRTVRLQPPLPAFHGHAWLPLFFLGDSTKDVVCCTGTSRPQRLSSELSPCTLSIEVGGTALGQQFETDLLPGESGK